MSRMLCPTGVVWLRDVGGVVGCLQQGRFKQGWEGNRGFCAQALKGFDFFFIFFLPGEPQLHILGIFPH